MSQQKEHQIQAKQELETKIKEAKSHEVKKILEDRLKKIDKVIEK